MTAETVMADILVLEDRQCDMFESQSYRSNRKVDYLEHENLARSDQRSVNLMEKRLLKSVSKEKPTSSATSIQVKLLCAQRVAQIASSP
jgi:hypothetical protein